MEKNFHEGITVLRQITLISTSQVRGPLLSAVSLVMVNLLVWNQAPAAEWPPPDSPPAHASDAKRGAAQSAEESHSLEPGKPIERELSGGRSHFYKITMTSGQYLQVVVRQRGIDALVALFTPEGKKIDEVDSEQATEGAETISAIAEASGAYKIEVRSAEKTAQTGRYEIEVEKLREATAEDKCRVAAELMFREAKQLENGTLEDRKKSIDKYQEALKLYRKTGDRSAEAETLNNIGKIYYYLGERQKALETVTEALTIFRAAGDRSGEATTLHNIGAFYRSLGETQKALENYTESLTISRALGDRYLEVATLNGTGAAYWSLGERRKALEKYNESLTISRAIGDRNQEAVTLSNIGLAYWSLGEQSLALEKYNESLKVSREIGDRNQEAVTLNNIGMAHLELGERQKALEKCNESLTVSRVIGYRNQETVTLSNIGLAYWSLGEWQKALEKYNEALTLSRAIVDRIQEGITLICIGTAYRRLGKMQMALEKYSEALPILRTVGDRVGEASALTNIGAVYHSRGEMRKALEKYSEALTISQSIGDRKVESSTLNSVGTVYRSLGEMQKALENYGKALSIRRAIGDRDAEADTLLQIALAEQKRGNLPQARQTIEQAIGIIESLRAEVRMQDLRASFFASRREYYESYIELLMEQRRQNPAAAFDAEAFAVSERARARSLLELLTESRADIRQGVDDSLLKRERSLQQMLNAEAAAQAALLNRKHTAAQAEAAAKELASITAEYDELRAQIRASSPKYAALTQPQPLNLTEIQRQALDPDTLLLEYSLGDNASYLFVASQTALTSHQLPKRAEIEAATRRVLDLLTAPQPQPGDTVAKYQARNRKAGADYWTQAATLSRMLLGPVASQLSGKRLLIVADGALQYLPFGALPLPESGRAGERESGRAKDKETRRQRGEVNPQSAIRNPQSAIPTPLIVNHEVVHLPSASALAVLRRELAGRQPAEKAVAVLADPVFSKDDARVKSGSKTQAGGEAAPDLTRAIGAVRGELRRLLMTRGEAEAILSVTPPSAGLKALDFQADRATATGDELSRYRIVHFATHGLLNSQHPELSCLALSLVDERGRSQDGFLRLHEIFNLRLPAELVVLSACQTGLGKEVKGEGLVGLTRGFMYAGAARVVASLWRVDDTATAELMKLFYRRMLRDGMRPAAALREAQVEMWKMAPGRSPFYWAGFVLQGEWR
jgi:CHAT domain-containing protein/tetratricopeptide (TPR) repeat protein